jgi:putative ubiquitin-RnfH superfamily antitoxin RatB of RatAB toxin-antitoxin module
MTIRIEIIYATPFEQFLIVLDLIPNTSVEKAINCSGILKRYPEIHLQKNKIGIFGSFCHLQDLLSDGDRIEIYRFLMIDPKEARKQRALKNIKKY